MADYSKLTGRDFEFLIVHPDELEIPKDTVDKLMTLEKV